MPNCFQLMRKAEPKAGAVVLQKVDEEICRHFGARVDQERWYYGWYDDIGFRLALGRNWEQIKAEFTGLVQKETKYKAVYERLLAITEYLEQNFVTDTWAEVGRSSS